MTKATDNDQLLEYQDFISRNHSKDGFQNVEKIFKGFIVDQILKVLGLLKYW